MFDNFAAIFGHIMPPKWNFYTIAQPTFRNIWLIYELSMLEDFEMEQKYVTNMH